MGGGGLRRLQVPAANGRGRRDPEERHGEGQQEGPPGALLLIDAHSFHGAHFCFTFFFLQQAKLFFFFFFTSLLWPLLYAHDLSLCASMILSMAAAAAAVATAAVNPWILFMLVLFPVQT